MKLTEEGAKELKKLFILVDKLKEWNVGNANNIKALLFAFAEELDECAERARYIAENCVEEK